jgi:hypothetical protein
MVGECKAFNVPPACPKQSGSAFPLIALAAAAVVGLVLMAQKRDR